MKKVGETNRLWYRRTFEVPPAWRGRRMLLHFGASTGKPTVYRQRQGARHARGGYDAFTFDITTR